MLLAWIPIIGFLAAPSPTTSEIAGDAIRDAIEDAAERGKIGASLDATDVDVDDDAASSDEDAAEPAGEGKVTIKLWSENLRQGATVQIGRDGKVDARAAKTIKKLFRCKRTNRQRKIDRGVLGFVARVGAKWPGTTITVVSAYRGMRREKRTSHHRAGEAVDFRISGVPITKIRDFMWRNFRDVGVGYYPESGFVHVDHRVGEPDIAWTEHDGKMRFHPSWAERIRSARDDAKAKWKAKQARRQRAGV